MNLLARAPSNLRLRGVRLSRSLSPASLITLLCLVAPPAFAVTYADEANFVRLS
jgi:hypothetical protein